MNILLFDLGSYTQKDLIYYLKKRGCSCKNILYKLTDIYHDNFLERKFKEQLLRSEYDFVLSTNFCPVVAKICFQQNIKYISWVYDSPINSDRMEYYQFPTSYIFIFDRLEVERLLHLGAKNIYHLPLAINPERMHAIPINENDRNIYSSEISFIGQFYTSSLRQITSTQDDYDQGYIDAIIDTQFRIYGYNFIAEMVTDDLVSRLNQRLHDSGCVDELTKRGLIHSIATLITRTERLVLLNMLGQSHQVCYYSTEQPKELSHLTYCGTAYYHTEMPKIFRLSKLNLNPTLKSIQSGIPLRALDILGCGGVLLSNYQPELAEYFIDGEDVIMYESIEDALCKADYYLKHEDKRIQLAQSGYQKAVTHFAYPDRITTMLKTAGII